MYKQDILIILLNFTWHTNFAQAPPDICENKIPPYWLQLYTYQTQFENE